MPSLNLQIDNDRQRQHVEQNIRPNMKTSVCKPNGLGVAIYVGDGAIPEPLKGHTCGNDGSKGPQSVGKHHDGHDSVCGITSVLVTKDPDI